MVEVMSRLYPRPPHRSRRALLTHRAPPSGRTWGDTRFEPACAPAHSRQSDRRGSSAQCPNHGGLSAVPLGGGPSLHDLRRKLPSFVRSLPRYYDLIRLLIRVHARRTASAFPSRPGTSPGTGETSQVPHKELHHVRKAFDCARICPCKPIRHGRSCLLVRELDRHLGIRPVSQLNTRPVVYPVNASLLSSQTVPRASLVSAW